MGQRIWPNLAFGVASVSERPASVATLVDHRGIRPDWTRARGSRTPASATRAVMCEPGLPPRGHCRIHIHNLPAPSGCDQLRVGALCKGQNPESPCTWQGSPQDPTPKVP